MKKAVIFDLNGVFILSPKLSDRFFETYGVAQEIFLPALSEVMAQVRMPEAEGMYSYWKPYFDAWDLEITEEELEDFWFTAEKENIEMVAVARTCKERGMQLFILSNNLRERSFYYNKNFPFLKELFVKVYYSWQTGYVKPDVRCFELVLRENNLKAEECLFFDDSEKNVAVAAGLGIESFVYEDALQAKEKLGLN